MSRLALHREQHRVSRVGWLRAAVLGANDGLVSTASLIIGVAAAEAAQGDIMVAGVAGLVAGAMSMAAGEYVSVSSQSDTEKADLQRERMELATDPEGEVSELAGIYEARGADPDVASQVAEQLTAKDALGAHARDELGISEFTVARPVQAAVTSALTFAAGASPPLVVALLAPSEATAAWVATTTLAGLMGLGALGGAAGGANIGRAVLRVGFWGILAMAATAAIGSLFGTVV